MNTRFNTQTKVTVRFSDTDAMGHCNNARMFTYMEEGRGKYFSKLYPDRNLADQWKLFPFILADIQCSFKTPAYFGETLIVGVGVTEFGTKSFVIEYEIIDEKTERLVATGNSVLVMYDYQKKESYPVPQDIKDRINNIDKVS